MERAAYATDLKDVQWNIIAPMLILSSSSALSILPAHQIHH